MLEGNDDPRTMDGRALANRLHRHLTAPERDWNNIMFWTGVMMARLLEYQDLLVVAGIIKSDAAPDVANDAAAPGNKPGTA